MLSHSNLSLTYNDGLSSLWEQRYSFTSTQVRSIFSSSPCPSSESCRKANSLEILDDDDIFFYLIQANYYTHAETKRVSKQKNAMRQLTFSFRKNLFYVLFFFHSGRALPRFSDGRSVKNCPKINLTHEVHGKDGFWKSTPSQKNCFSDYFSIWKYSTNFE